MNDFIEQLLHYGFIHHLCKEEDICYCRNLILDVLQLPTCEEVTSSSNNSSLQDILQAMIQDAIKRGIIDDSQDSRDRFDSRIMNCLMPRPSEIIQTFNTHYQKLPQAATKYYYQLSCDSNYIRKDRIAKDQKWITKTKYGDLDITINLSKPEKDPKDIAKAKLLPPANYPKCLLCKENEGYAGFGNHPARNNHRLIPVQLNKEKYYLQYSPYSYYPEHCIIFHEEHRPMVINHATFTNLLSFVQHFPHYFVGSNADLPIVGGSILTHDHFQGGNFTFAMAKAPRLEARTSKKYPSVQVGRIYWPLSVLRLTSENAQDLADYANDILTFWKSYNNKELAISSHSGDIPHHTITPIVRMHDGFFEMDLTLRNNRTSSQYPDGIFHPHQPLHHIKKENIGLIEVMGLAVLPSRLKKELKIIEDCLVLQLPLPTSCQSHLAWFKKLRQAYPNPSQSNIHKIIEEEVGHIFEAVLEDSGVFKQDKEGQDGFLALLKEIEELR